MPIPNLIHPVPILIQQIDTAETLYDDELREPVQQSVRGATVTVDGQVKWGLDQSVDSERRGAQEDSDGYVLFRYVDLQAQGVTLKHEDRFIKLGTLDVDVYVTSLRPEGHYSDTGGPTLVKAFFADRQPSRQTRGA